MVRGYSLRNSAFRTAMASVIVLRRDGTLSQHPLIIPQTRLESWGWLGRGGRRPLSIEWTPVIQPCSENGTRPAKTYDKISRQ
jgi:hypothetical protein